jgi:peptidoglycan hydrolase-like protein with peptidoglycan-binding domain
MSDTTATEPTLRQGDEGVDGWVEYLQHLLNGHGLAVPVSGSFDATTQQAVITFQLRNGLLVDGVVGNQTWAALRQEAPRPIGTDGLEPHTFQEVGPEARWFTEFGPPFLAPDQDTLVIPAVNTGSVSLSPGEFDATGTIIVDGAPVDSFTLTLFTEGGLPVAPGDFMSFVSPGFSSRVRPGEQTVVARMADELGGDEAVFTIPFDGGTGPPPPKTDGVEFGIRILDMDADSQAVSYTAQAIGVRGGAGSDILVWVTDDQAETEAVQVPFEIGPRGSYQRRVPTPAPILKRMNEGLGQGFTVELSTNAGAGNQGEIDRESRSVPGPSGGF